MLVDEILHLVRTLPGETVRVVDSEGLVRSVAVIDALGGIGVDVVFWEEPLVSRLAWERAAPPGGRLVVIAQAHRSSSLPADVLATAEREVTVTGKALFAPFDPAVIEQLDWPDRVRAHEAASDLTGARLDRRDTAVQLLRRLYRLDSEATKGLAQVLEALLRHHLRARAAPISAYLASVFAGSVGDPLPGILTSDALIDREAFLAWLGRFWAEALTRQDGSEALRAALSTGPAELLDDYFDRGLIAPVAAEEAIANAPFGIDADPAADKAKRVEAGLVTIEQALDAGVSTEGDWAALASEWADVLLAQFTTVAELPKRFRELRLTLNQTFTRWALEHYSELASLPISTGPPMVHHVNRYIERYTRDGKVALVVVDGLSLAAWRLFAPGLRRPDWHIREATCYAWIPTITSISRQAIFSGKPPLFFPSAIGSLEQEPKLWAAWWEKAKFQAHEVGYVKLHVSNVAAEGGLEGDPDFLDALGKPVVGIVVNDVDHEMHHETLHEGVLYASLDTWQRQGHLAKLLAILVDSDYMVFLTSDHGFVGVKSIGVSQAGVTAHPHGRFERYQNEALYQQAITKHGPERIPWINFGLPDDYLVLLAPTLAAMKPKGSHLTTHGGATLEEVIVPWVEDPSVNEPIGFDRLIELDWLDLAASRYAATGEMEKAIADTTELVAMTTAGGGASRFAVRKNMTIVGRIWLKVPERAVPLRDAAAHALLELGPVDRMAVHWSMCQLAYPFYLAAAGVAGRSFAAQGVVTVAALRSRLSERWGAVAVLPVAARKVLGTWICWGVVHEARRASYEPVIAGSVTPFAARFVAEARVLADAAGSVDLDDLQHGADLFPFELPDLRDALQGSQLVSVQREGGRRSVARATV